MPRFDPSSTKFTDMALKFLSSIALDDLKLNRKKKAAKSTIEQLKSSGLLGKDFEISGFDLESGVPKIGRKGSYKPKTRQDAISFEKDKYEAKYGIDDDGTGYKGPATLKPAKTPAVNWGQASLRSRVAAALTPGATDTEKRLGPLRPGGVFRPPRAAAPIAQAQAVPAQAPVATQQAEVQLPPEVTTTSQAVDFLVQSQGMSKEQAIQYLRQLNAR